MPKIIVQPGQSLLDVAVQYYGTVEGVYDLVRRNRLNGLVDNLEAGQALKVADKPQNARVARFLAPHQVATMEDSLRGSGIGWWGLRRDFCLSPSGNTLTVALSASAAEATEGENVKIKIALGRAAPKSIDIALHVARLGGISAEDYSLSDEEGNEITTTPLRLRFQTGEVAKYLFLSATADSMSPETGEGLLFSLNHRTQVQELEIIATQRTLSLPITDVPPPRKLIPVRTLEQLDAIRYDLDGDGIPTEAHKSAYEAAFGTNLFEKPVIYEGYQLANDLDFKNGATDPAQYSIWAEGSTATGAVAAGWAPIGSPFTANFDGNGHTIENLYINRSAGRVGLFERVEGIITHLGLKNVQITNLQSGETGTLVGRLLRGRISFCYATGSLNSQASPSDRAGGLVGYSWTSILYANYATCTLSGGYTGGIVGWASTSSKIRACYFAGTLSGSNKGGIMGRGFNNSTEIQACYAAGNATSLYGSRNSAKITNSYYDSGAADAGSFGKATTNLKAPTGYTGIYAAWNIDKDGNTGGDPWDFGTDSQYPVLKVDFNKDNTATWQEFGDQQR